MTENIKMSGVLLLSLLTTTLMLSDDFLQQIYSVNNHAELELSYVFVMLALNTALWVSGRRWFVLPVIGCFAAMQFLQLAHISYIGQPLSPVDISRLYSERSEVSGVVGSAAAEHWPFLLAWGLPYLALVLLFHRFLPTTRRRWAPVAMLAVIAALASKPQRAMKFDMIHFMPGPTRSSLHNSLNAFSYYLTRMSFGRDRFTRLSYAPYRVSPHPVVSPPDHLWIVLGESLRASRMSLYGYQRATTPHLDALMQQQKLVAMPGIAMSVATGSTIPLFVNGVAEPGNLPALKDKVANLFRLAKASGYRTFWISAQESKLLSDTGEQWIDIRSTREDAPLEFSTKGDRALEGRLDKLLTHRKTFGIIQLRAAHLPYEEAYERDPDFEPPWGREVSQGDRYDNAMRYVDESLSRLMAKLIGMPGSHEMIITSDHGQLLGEDGLWGHNRLRPEVANVPVIRYAPERSSADFPRSVMTHADLHAWLAGRLGWQVTTPDRPVGVAWFHGNEPYGNNLYIRIDRNGWSEPQLLSRLGESCQGKPVISCL